MVVVGPWAVGQAGLGGWWPRWVLPARPWTILTRVLPGAQVLGKKVGSSELLQFLYPLIEGLLDAESASASGACVVLNGIFRIRVRPPPPFLPFCFVPYPVPSPPRLRTACLFTPTVSALPWAPAGCVAAQGVELGQEIGAVLDALHAKMVVIDFERTRTGLLRAIRTLAAHHLAAVVAKLQTFDLPCVADRRGLGRRSWPAVLAGEVKGEAGLRVGRPDR